MFKIDDQVEVNLGNGFWVPGQVTKVHDANSVRVLLTGSYGLRDLDPGIVRHVPDHISYKMRVGNRDSSANWIEPVPSQDTPGREGAPDYEEIPDPVERAQVCVKWFNEIRHDYETARELLEVYEVARRPIWKS